MNLRSLILSCLLGLCFSCQKQTPTTHTTNPSPTTIFKKIKADVSGLNFNNKIQENLATKENLFNYDYFYNGAGVGIEDLNNDGLLDIFFCGNQVANKLYLNKGSLKFEDISSSSGISSKTGWSNGVTFVDINQDGWMDIYVSQGGPKDRAARKNLLYINQQNNTFKEEAENYGLADQGISTQTAFFDYDMDGDLDCIVMNENEYYGVDPINLYKLIENNEEAQYYNSSHLYRNDNGKFTEVSKLAGIQRPIFGLGLSVSDINKDGWPDFYIASDYYIPDALFINNQDGTFTDQIKTYTQQVSFYGMGMDIADINNDGLQDIFVLDMAANDHVRSKTLMASMNTGRFNYLINKAGFHHQYMYNALQLNQANNNFSNISQATTMANTDWSWSVLLSDFDHDADKDVYITNGYRRYALDNDLQRQVYNAKLKYKGKVPLAVKTQLYESMPSEKLPNILYQNNGDLNFKEQAKNWGLATPSFSNGAAQGDLDNDGDLDLVVNNIDETCFLYQNLTMENNLGNYIMVDAQGKLSESFPKISIKYNGQQQIIETRRVRGYRSSHQNIAHFGLGQQKTIDTITVAWPNGEVQEKYNVKANGTISFSQEKETEQIPPKAIKQKTFFTPVTNTKLGLNYTHKENVYDDFEKEILLPYKQSTLGPFITKADINGDEREDFYVGGASGQSGSLYLQMANGSFKKVDQAAFNNDSNYEDMAAVFFDFDNDQDLDLFVVSGGNEFEQYSSLYADRLYLNNGSGTFSRANIDALTANPKSGRSVATIDYDQDGDLDLLVGNRIIPKNYPNYAPSTLWENHNGQLKDVTTAKVPELAQFGMVNDILPTDFNNDGQTDFIAVGEWTTPGFFINNKGSFSLLQNEKLSDTKGWWFSVQETDINNDGLPDYVLGNIGLNIKFKTNKKKPFQVYANDFDDNGTPDIVLSKKYNGDYVPVRGRECSSQQMPFIQQKFESYASFANAKLVDIYGDKLNTAYKAEANEFKSLVLINQGNNNFTQTYLPIAAQLYPILSTVVKDINKDGYQDLIVAGNIYNTEVETPRLDALSGTVLLSNGKDNYTALSPIKTGLLLKGNIKDISTLKTKEGTLLLATQNNGTLFAHKMVAE